MNIIGKLEAGIRTATESETLQLAAELATELPPDTTVTLSGDLGAGKTTFVKGFARGLGITADVTSPSFNLCNFHQGTRMLAHVDAYRLSGDNDWGGLMIEEFLRSPWMLIVEWPERVADALPEPRLDLTIEALPDGSRLIKRTRGRHAPTPTP